MAHFFIDRPVFAWVLALFVLAAGLLSITQLPVARHPNIAPPSATVSTTYPGASAIVVDQGVTSLIEEELLGADGLLYIESRSQADGGSRVTATFRPGTDIELAAVEVQNRLQRVQRRLPDAVLQQGLQVTRTAGDFLMFVSLYSPDGRLDPVALGDFAVRNVLNEIRRVPGVGEAQLFGTERAMRVWIDPARLEGLRLTPADVAAAIRAQNLQVPAGALGDQPARPTQQIAASLIVGGQLATPEAFGEIPLRVERDGSVVRLRDVARIELGGMSYATRARLNGQPATAIGVRLATDANAVATADAVRTRLDELSRFFPPGVAYEIPSDLSRFVRESIRGVVSTLVLAVVLVFGVMYLFLQDLRATLIPTLVMPIALMGAFGTLLALGFSINVLTLFGLVLAIGILVDDAIVVVENVDRIMTQEGLPPREATRKAMGQVAHAIIGTTLVLVSVLVPMAFFGGAVGAIYQQFAASMGAAIVFSTAIALSLTPALCATLLKPRPRASAAQPRRGLFGLFNRGFDAFSSRYHATVDRMLRRIGRAILAYVVVAIAAAVLMIRLPGAFLPDEDQGSVLTSIQLPPGATVGRTAQVLEQVERFYLSQPGVQHVIGITGFSFQGSGQNAGQVWTMLKPWAEREQSAGQLIDAARAHFAANVRDAIVLPMNPPAVRGLGVVAGFNLRLQDRASLGHDPLVAARERLVALANESPVLQRVRAEGLRETPQLALNIDRDRLAAQGLTMADVAAALSASFGAAYVSDFPNLGRQQRVIVQAVPERRLQPHDVARLTVRNAHGEMVPFAAFSESRWLVAPVQLLRFNGYPALAVSGQAAPGYSSGDAMAEIERLIGQLPQGIGYEWTGQSYEERLLRAQAPVLLALSVLAVFLCLAALYESWTLPVAAMLVVPLGLLGAALFVTIRAMPNDVYFTVGLVAIIGLSAKNAILIVEFARRLQAGGATAVDAVRQALRQRL
ncbi:MAG TPA: multidrug efflux RND transporter permease subunit, partial [Burkholderiaceae bacterium]|nr:multidrug efflux RND transporter permease subunit [Burkholderiaceae bacterium]